MPHREPLLRQLARYLERHPEDAERTGPMLELVRGTAACFSRDCYPGHVTASAWIVAKDRGQALLTHHRKLGRWLQLGGHADGENLVHEVALREAREESGLRELVLVGSECLPVPFDVDVHWIPPRRDEPGHWHHDARFLLIAGAGDLVRSDESNDLRWFDDGELLSAVAEESVLRLWRRAKVALGR